MQLWMISHITNKFLNLSGLTYYLSTTWCSVFSLLRASFVLWTAPVSPRIVRGKCWCVVNNQIHSVLSVFFHRTNTLLEKVAAAVEQSAFYSALWGSILTSPAVRLPGVSFVLLHLNRKLSMEDQLYVMGNDIELMVSDKCSLPVSLVRIFKGATWCN